MPASLSELVEQARNALPASGDVWFVGTCHVRRSDNSYSAEGFRLRFTANLTLEQAVELAYGQDRANSVAAVIGQNHAKD